MPATPVPDDPAPSPTGDAGADEAEQPAADAGPFYPRHNRASRRRARGYSEARGRRGRNR